MPHLPYSPQNRRQFEAAVLQPLRPIVRWDRFHVPILVAVASSATEMGGSIQQKKNYYLSFTREWAEADVLTNASRCMPLCSERLSVNVVLDVAAAGVAFGGIEVVGAFTLFTLVASDGVTKFVFDVVVVVVAVVVELSIVVNCSSTALLLTELDVAFAVELFKLVILCVFYMDFRILIVVFL